MPAHKKGLVPVTRHGVQVSSCKRMSFCGDHSLLVPAMSLTIINWFEIVGQLIRTNQTPHCASALVCAVSATTLGNQIKEL